MARSSTAVLRAAAILDFLAEHPGESFTMAELVRSLRLSQSTCHSLLNALVEVGYLFRTSEKSYALGPRMAAIANVAGARHSLLQIAKPELRRLADKFDLVCSALVLEGDQSVVRERSTSARHVGYTSHIGLPLRLRAQLASAFFVSSPDRAEEWLARGFDNDIDAERTVLKQGIDFLRRHGFLVLLNNPFAPSEDTPFENIFDGDVSRLPVTLPADFDPQETYDVSSIVVPVFNAAGGVEFVLSLIGYEDVLEGAKVLELADEMKRASTRISSFVIDPRNKPSLLQV